MTTNKPKLFRLILPAFPPFNIYMRIAKTTTSLGPIFVATAASRIPGWEVEVIDESNCRSKFCPQDEFGRPDHRKINAERPADLIGFYGSMSSAMPRLFELAALYKQMGATTISGGYHVRNLPEEAISQGIDIVVLGEAEEVMGEILQAINNNRSFEEIPGLVFSQNGQTVRTVERPPIANLDILPLPNFSVLRYARIKIFPISRVRGCNMNCEFCAVKDRVRSISPKRMMEHIAYLVENFGARDFFECSDHFAPNPVEAIEFCCLMEQYQKNKGVRLRLTVQDRLSDAKNDELLTAMKKAGIVNVCVGFESPIDEELKLMKKGYLAKDMIDWVKKLKRFGFTVHGMGIFGYPEKPERKISLSLKERERRFRSFIRHLNTAQVVLPVPLPGTELRARLSDRIFPLEIIDWGYYDGQYQVFMPDDGILPEEMQESIKRIMGGFYHFHNLWQLVIAVVVFLFFVGSSAVTIFTFRVRYVSGAFRIWKKRFWRDYSLRFGGHFIVKGFLKQFRKISFNEKLTKAREALRKRGSLKTSD